MLGTMVLLLGSCRKQDVITYLETSVTFINFKAAAGQDTNLLIRSNIAWEATIKPSTTDWLKIDNTKGAGNGKIIATILKENEGDIFRKALIEIKPVNNPTVKSIIILIEQQTFETGVAWQKSFGGSKDDYGRNAVMTHDGDYMMAGMVFSSDGDISGHKGSADGWLVKMDKHGNKFWSRAYGGKWDDYFTSIITTTDGGYALAGYSNSSDGDVPANKGAYDYWILRLNAAGNLIWKRSFGGNYEDKAHSITATTDGGFAVVGSSESQDGDVTGNHGRKDLWLLKINGNGDKEWEKSLGGSWDDVGYSVLSLPGGDIMVGGYTDSEDGDITKNQGFYDIWLARISNNGSVRWKKTLGGSGSESITAMANTADGGIITTGFTQSNNGDFAGSGRYGRNDGMVMKLDQHGNKIWHKTVGGSMDESLVAVIATSNGGYAVAGYSDSKDGNLSLNRGLADLWVLELNSSGNIIWSKTMGGSHNDLGTFLLSTADNYFLTGGWSVSQDGDITHPHGASDFWMVKFKSH